MRRDLVFVHIPKTAGTSLRQALRAAFPDAIHLYDYGPNEKLTSALIRELRYEKSALHQLRSRVDSSRRLLVMGHFEAEVYADYFAAENFITFVREPVARVVSDYKHFVRHHGYGGTLLEFAQQEDQRDKQSHFLSGLDVGTMGFVGVSEDFASEIVRFNEFVGAALEPPLVNEAPPDQQVEFNPATSREILSLNQADWQLYQSAILQRARAGTAKPVWGSVQGLASVVNGSVVGWAVAEQGRRIVSFDVMHDGKCMGTVSCDIYRPDLAAQSISATGIGGMSFKLEQFGVSEGEVVLRHPKLELKLQVVPTQESVG